MRNSGWIQTYTGKQFYPLDPNPDQIDIIDAAHALSNLCRFTGHCKSFYSVAQHSVLVSIFCDEKDALFGLLHDLSEAYICDIASPLKQEKDFDFYREKEKILQNIIYQKFCGSTEEPKSVKLADLRMLATEANNLMSPLHPDWKQPAEPFNIKIVPMLPEQAKQYFLDRFYELTK